MKTDKFLLGIIAGIILLVIVALGLVLARGQNETYVADDSPAGVVQNYFLAVQRKDYSRAYGYLADDLKSKPDLDDFIRDIGSNRSEASLKIGEIRPGKNTAQVDVAITTYSSGGIFDSGPYTNDTTADLRLAPDGKWKITSFPYPYWGYNWND